MDEYSCCFLGEMSNFVVNHAKTIGITNQDNREAQATGCQEICWILALNLRGLASVVNSLWKTCSLSKGTSQYVE